ncbi:MAG: class I SAM-dependent methyltransferase [Acidimicrobiia bacterium]|nr:class I SAM-dependent methyltransferase [Acidimicrobiia bacterium]
MSSLLRRLVSRLRPSPSSPDAAPAGPPTDYPASPWDPFPEPGDNAVTCNICHWRGDGFEGGPHSEAATCPACGSIARDRFLFWALQRHVEPCLGARVLETSPRMGHHYRAVMAGWFDYRCSDFDLRAHVADIQIDLQAIDLPDDSIDIVMTPHVLEHVPDFETALAELSRVIAPGGTLILQVPVLQGHTAPPVEPEFHGDDTPVFWRFGPGLTDHLASAGFEAELLATAEIVDAAATGRSDLPSPPEVDGPAVIAALADHPATATADRVEARRHGFEPALHFFTWIARHAG